MEHDEIIAIIQAHKDNKQLQSEDDYGIYKDAEPNVELRLMLQDISYDYEWRVKPEPREFYLAINTNGSVDHCTQYAGDCRLKATYIRAIEVIE